MRLSTKMLFIAVIDEKDGTYTDLLDEEGIDVTDEYPELL